MFNKVELKDGCRQIRLLVKFIQKNTIYFNFI